MVHPRSLITLAATLLLAGILSFLGTASFAHSVTVGSAALVVCNIPGSDEVPAFRELQLVDGTLHPRVGIRYEGQLSLSVGTHETRYAWTWGEGLSRNRNGPLRP